MTRLALVMTCGLMAIGTAARAQVTNVTGASTTQVKLNDTFNITDGGPGLVSQGGGAAYYSSFSSGSVISFESGNASMKGDNRVSSTSSSSVDITIKNGGSSSVNATMQSQITGAGLGYYLANTSGPCGGSSLFSTSGGDPFGGCAQTSKPLTFANLNASNVSPLVPAAGVSFDFTISVGGTQVYDFTGSQTITLIPGSLNLALNPLVLSDANVLQGLNHVVASPNSADGYTWDASNVNIALGALGAGASEDVVYTATVTTFSNIGCTIADPTVCLVPYAAFGDPIGRGGGISGAARPFGLDFNPLPNTAEDPIQYVDDWGPQTFQFPTFDFRNGILSFKSAVPEPKTWMSLILGFGFIGAALRRRRILS